MYVSGYGFHDYQINQLAGQFVITSRRDTEYTYTFENFFHPYVGELIEKLNRKSLPGMLDAKFHAGLEADFFESLYKPRASNQQVSFGPFPKKAIDVLEGGPYSGYNWELLFHVPFGIAVHLSKSQRFAEAMRWFHYIFDPTSTDTSVPGTQRYWKFLRFRQGPAAEQIDEILMKLSKPDQDCGPAELAEKVRILEGYQAILDHPFQPHRVARTRIIAYQYAVIMKYLDNLIAWGDSLFAQDTVETINEATQRYVLAANLLGPRPQRVPERGTVRSRTYRQLKDEEIDAFGNAIVELEGKFPFNAAPPRAPGSGQVQSGSLLGFGRTLYFCVPRNEKLLGYWDIVDDRLRKIRNCMNIQGVVRSLALFDPPLDPGMLVRAAAAGIDMGSIVAGLNQPIGPVCARTLIQRALELCGEVKTLGTALLGAVEKREGEALALLRQGHELRIQEIAQNTRFLQWKQAEEATETLLRSRAGALERYDFALRALGVPRDANAVPDSFALGARTPISEENFDEVFGALVGQFDRAVSLQPYGSLRLAGESRPDAQSGATGVGQLFLNEAAELNVFGPSVRSIRDATMAADTIAAILALIPDMGIDLAFWGLGGHANVFGGTYLSAMARFYSSVRSTEAAGEEFKGATASKVGSFERRADDLLHQANAAAHDLMSIGRQLVGSLIAEQTAHQEYLSVKEQIVQNQAVDRFLREKFSSEELYGWMQGELSRLYYEYYRLAFDVARRAERTVKHELMRPELDNAQFVKFNYWDGGRRGLLSGEGLFLDLKRLELAYDENDQWEFQLTRNVPLRQIDPVALLTLKATDSCSFTVPEALFDLDCDGGHYHRRLRSVALSIPSVVGPHAPLHATLTLLRSTVRTSALLKDGVYARQPEDDRFVDYLGTIQQIVTSGGSNDAGMFDAGQRDDRPPPFAGAGAESTWRLDLPKAFPTFDRASISDVVLHLRYTARQGGETLAKAAMTELTNELVAANTAGPTLLFSLPHDFPTEWAAFAAGSQDFAVVIREDYFPFWAQNGIAIDAVDVARKTGTKLGRRSVLAAPANKTALDALATGLNATDGNAVLTLSPDASILVRSATDPVFLLIRYHRT